MEKVKAGDKVVIRASTWNAFIDAANWTKEQRQNQYGKGLRSGVGTGIVLMKNGESEPRDRFTALVLSDIAIPPNVNEDEFVSCAPVFVGQKMTEEREGKPYAILLQPLAAGEIGRAMVLGIVPAKVNIEDAEDEYAVPTPGSSTGALKSDATGVARIIWKAGGGGEQWCLLQLGGAGGGTGGEKAYMCKVNSGSVKSGYQVTVYPNGREDSSTIYNAVLYMPDLALDSDLPSGAWLIGHKCALKATGGEDK